MSSKATLKGTYCLIINLEENCKISIGKLGEIEFQKGYYAYVGSALNSLEARVKRHLAQEKKLHWHIDYFLAQENTEVIDVIYSVDQNRWECRIAREIADNSTCITSFGCSDCKCQSHLFYFKSLNYLEEIVLNAFKKYDLVPKSYLKYKN